MLIVYFLLKNTAEIIFGIKKKHYFCRKKNQNLILNLKKHKRMKKFYLLTVLVAFVSFTFAQRTAMIEKKYQKLEVSKTPTDTLIPASFATGSPTLYKAAGGGYVVGTNSYGDLAKAQQFLVTSAYNVEGAVVWFGAKEQIGTAGPISIKCYKNDGAGTAGSGAVTTAPGTVLGTIASSVDLIDTTAFNFYNFTTPINVTADYSIGVDFSTVGDDTLGIVSTTDGDGGGAELNWEKWSDGTWYTMVAAWPLDFDFAIFAIVDMNAGGVNDNYFIDGIKLSQNQPNPASNSTLVQYEIQNSGSVTLEVYDMTGRLVLSYDEGKQLAGKHNILVDSDKLTAGSYYYSLKADSHRLTKKMVVAQ